ncbi:MAG: hypothetical protein ACOYT8_05685 [Candidatus Dependentiae bacterium]
MTFSLRSTRIISGFILSLITTSALGSEVNTTNHFMTGLNTLANNCKTIGWNVLSGIGTGVVNTTHAVVPASELFKQTMENPKAAIGLGSLVAYVGYKWHSAKTMDTGVKLAHNYINPNNAQTLGSPRIGLLLQDCYENPLKKLLVSRSEYSLLENPSLIRAQILLKIKEETEQLNEHISTLSSYLHRSTLIPRIPLIPRKINKWPVILEQILDAQGKTIAQIETFTHREMNQIENELKRRNVLFYTNQNLNPLKDFEWSIDEQESRLAMITQALGKGVGALARLIVGVPKAVIVGGYVTAWGLNRFAGNLLFSEQRSQIDYWLAFKQKAALVRLKTELTLEKIRQVLDEIKDMPNRA